MYLTVSVCVEIPVRTAEGMDSPQPDEQGFAPPTFPGFETVQVKEVPLTNDERPI
jgi:hypothetical protein